jgi:hypothetical protein
MASFAAAAFDENSFSTSAFDFDTVPGIGGGRVLRRPRVRFASLILLALAAAWDRLFT